ncbi:MAG: hypothetical protein Q9180_000765 [Flavoplaca navasiana]
MADHDPLAIGGWNSNNGNPSEVGVATGGCEDPIDGAQDSPTVPPASDPDYWGNADQNPLEFDLPADNVNNNNQPSGDATGDKEPQRGWSVDEPDGEDPGFTQKDYQRFERSCHLSVLADDNISYAEIYGIKDVLENSCSLNLTIAIEREASYIEVKASFPRDFVSSTNFKRTQNMSYKLYAGDIANAEKLAFINVTSMEDIKNAPMLCTSPMLQQYIDDGQLYSLTIEPYGGWVSEGIEDARTFSEPSQVRAANVFRSVGDKTQITVFIRSAKVIQGALEKLKKKMILESKRGRFRQYMTKAGTYQLAWGAEKFSRPGMETYVRPVRDTFIDIQHWRLTQGYGAMRENEYQLLNIMKTLQQSMTASFVVFPEEANNAGAEVVLREKYIAFLTCNSEELVKAVYGQGTRGTLCFDKPDPDATTQPQGWSYHILPAIPNFEYNGNLVFLITRPEGDTRKLPCSRAPSMDMIEQNVWAFPETTDLAVRRLINCANKVSEADTSEKSAAEMHRLLMARDLREGIPTDILANLTRQQRRAVNKVINTMSETQKQAWEHIQTSPHKIVLLQGPPGTGKTTFIVKVLKICEICNIPYTAGGASNVSTDVIASRIYNEAPYSGVIRPHSLGLETRSLRTFSKRPVASTSSIESISSVSGFVSTIQRFLILFFLSLLTVFTNPTLTNPTFTLPASASTSFFPWNPVAPPPSSAEEQGPPTKEEIENAMKELEFSRLMVDLWKGNVNKQWRSVKNMRPNFKHMALQVRVLQNIGLIPHNIPAFKTPLFQTNPHRELATMISEGNSRDWSTDRKSQYLKLRNIAIANTIGKVNGLVTTLSNMMDKTLVDNKRAKLTVVDEACQASELESVIPLLNNHTTLGKAILIGDPRQLHPTITSLNANRPAFENRDGTVKPAQVINAYAPQMSTPLFTRLYHRGYPIFRLIEQFRAAAGLEQIYSELFYEGTLINAPSTHGRPEAAKSVQWIQRNYNVRDEIPHVFLQTPTGVSLRQEDSTSTINPMNVVVCINVVRKMVIDKLWQPKEITIICPYRAQADLLRRLLRKLRVGTIDNQVEVSTIDAMQARENECIVLELTLASTRQKKGYGHTVEADRLCVALSRARNMFVVVGDDALAARADQPAEVKLLKYIQGVFTHFRTRRMTYLVDPTKMEEYKHVDMQRSNEVYLQRHKFACSKCGQDGHKASACTNPADSTRPQVPRPCRLCGAKTHEINNCPDRTCNLCQQKGHQRAACPLRKCEACGGLGHVKKECSVAKGKQWRFKRPGLGTNSGVEPLGNDESIPKKGEDEARAWANVKIDEQLITDEEFYFPLEKDPKSEEAEESEESEESEETDEDEAVN